MPCLQVNLPPVNLPPTPISLRERERENLFFRGRATCTAGTVDSVPVLKVVRKSVDFPHTEYSYGHG